MLKYLTKPAEELALWWEAVGKNKNSEDRGMSNKADGQPKEHGETVQRNKYTQRVRWLKKINQRKGSL